MPTAIDPTPPVAPVTSTGPVPGCNPARSRASTDSAAVYPAVPTSIAARASSPLGMGTTHPAGTRACVA